MTGAPLARLRTTSPESVCHGKRYFGLNNHPSRNDAGPPFGKQETGHGAEGRAEAQ
jgi:hypothetical protein